MRIALDLFGGDNAPKAIIDGAKLAVEKSKSNGDSSLKITLFGDHTRLQNLHLESDLPEDIDVLETPAFEIRNPNDPYSEAEQSDSPIRIALRKHNEGDFDGVVSAGSTGVQVIASIAELGRCVGITRPAVAAKIPTASGFCLILDVGASLNVTPHQMVQFAAMGTVYMKELLGKENLRIGVLNVSDEMGIGSKNATEAYQLLSASGFQDVSLVEGRDLVSGSVDIVLVNGFTGNILLKYIEELPKLLEKLFSKDLLREKISQFDYQLFGGEPLLGVRGVSIICHGASSEIAINAGIQKAVEIAKVKLDDAIEQFLSDKFHSYISKVRYLRSFRRSLKS